MDNDKADGEEEKGQEDDEVVVDENYDPLVAVQKDNEKAGPVLIGPLSFENEENDTAQNEHKSSDKSDGKNHASDQRAGGTRQFSGGLLSHAGGSGGQHGACLTLSDHDRIRIFIHELAIRGLLPFIERTMRSLYDLVRFRR